MVGWIACVLIPLAMALLLAFEGILHWREHGAGPTWLLAAGITLSLFLTLLAVFWAIYRSRTQEHMAHHLRALESLNTVTAAISARIGQGPQVLQQIADVSRALLGFDMSSILMRERNSMVNVLCASGATTKSIGVRYSMDKVLGVHRVLTDGVPLVVEDIDRSPVPLNRDGLRPFGVVSFVLVPLKTQGRILGALFLGSERRRRISEPDVRLAELWAAQAGVIVFNHKLYERMQQAMQTQKRLQEQREAMLHHSLAIYGDDSLEDALQRMADEVPPLLGVDIVTIALLTDQPYELQTMAATTTPQTMDLIGSTMDLRDSPGEECLNSGQPMAIVNASQEPRLPARLRDTLKASSVLFVPLLGSNGVIGKMTLVRHRAGEWAAETVQTAMYLAQRSAAAIETARLYQQSRADAQTKAMLLRELHHRVKNNLAGIVSLLSINQPELPPPAQQWLARATERIRVMARAHELFTGATTPLRLPQLMQSTLSSLSVLKPPGVRIQTRLEDVDVVLESDQAVALVMVLHELCHNAIVHGLGEEGTLTISAHPGGTNSLVIEVIDDGAPVTAAVAAWGDDDGTAQERRRPGPDDFRTGMGLGLVRGLVSRELHGKFELKRAATGGTRARIEFPLVTEN